MTDKAWLGEAALVREVRMLDRKDGETVADKLERLWDTQAQCHGGSFHAAEEMLLRWLLKNMAGPPTSTAAETIRRCPRAWDILGAIFSRIPLFSLAKSLADRRFVNVLQQTLKDISRPQQQQPQVAAQLGGADSDVEMANASPPPSPTGTRKRKRSVSTTLDLDVQSQLSGCLETAESVFEALRTLLSRCELRSSDGLPSQRMGAEHVKSLFSSSATKTMEILVPLLTLCRLAVNRSQETPLKGQAEWLSTFSSIWDLHLQSSSDAADVAAHLSGLGTSLLGNLTGFAPQKTLGISAAVQQRWARDLRRFLARNVILPSRAAFLNRGSQEVIQVTVNMAMVSAAVSYPVLFDLVSKQRRILGDKTAKKDYDAWIQAVFDATITALQSRGREKNRVIVGTIMDIAAERNTALSATSLRTVCKDYAIGPKDDWKLLLSIVKLNPDVFLVSQDGQVLLEQVLEKTRESQSFEADLFAKALQFIVSLAKGYAKARDLSSFVKVWLKYLAVAEAPVKLEPLWSQQELVTTVAGLLETSLNAKQLLEILDWLSALTQPAEIVARIHILEAISGGLSQEEFVDAASMKTFEAAFATKISRKELSSSVSASRWMIAEKTLSRGTLEESDQVLSRVKSELVRALQKSPVYREDTLAAFKCCAALWLSNYPHGEHESEAATLACAFLDRLDEGDGHSKSSSWSNTETSINQETYTSWILSSIVSLVVEKKKSVPNIILSLLSPGEEDDTEALESIMSASRLLLENETITNNYYLMHELLETMISRIDSSKSRRSSSTTRVAVQFLLDVPMDALSRSQREDIMKRLVLPLCRNQDKPEKVGVEFWKPVLSLMVKLMGRPTFYDEMSFAQLEAIGRSIRKSHRRSKEGSSADDVSEEWADFQLLKQLAELTIRQMANGNLEEREKAYLTGAVAVLECPCQDSDVEPRLALIQSFISVIQHSPSVVKSSFELEGLKTSHLLPIAVPPITSGKWRGKGLLPFLTALEAMGVLDHSSVAKALSGAVPSLLEAGNWLLEHGVQGGMETRMFLAKHFTAAMGSPLKIKLPARDGLDVTEIGPALDRAAVVGKTAVLEYVDAATQDADDGTRLGYLQELLLQDSDSSGSLAHLLVVHRLVHHISAGSRPATLPDSHSGFDLAQTHNILCNRLRATVDLSEFILTTRTLYLLLDQKAASMTQWNIELTLSSISALCSREEAAPTSSPKTYHCLCQLVEVVIKRHRRRLDGHFHILVTVLQSLLRRLMSLASSTSQQPHDMASNVPAPQSQHWEKQARLFARLVTLVCEPTAASVSSSSSSSSRPGSVLVSERDRAKRYAGQHMGLVLMQYVKLQLELAPLPLAVREPLDTAMYSVLQITTPDGLQIMSDAMDPSGRIIFKELYRQYQKFGKWEGV
ncbi:Urb2/Npa2 family-domain-containing protein [Lasiosphaeria miniovina]|uniref:Urb2/Npa2 family-domain-containing protein n=1 Tax=Lasiosphaeria miniovina TaxID=1954250 RepID=A0AA40A4K0_9PEZI|nr:Urb2/Npa2 family-domain-containing protein [Lasiosphaeria miniovina]KAK0709164.1 Urb2/Npa2 family-domain-containing protein [Lasiosphaeria miniovina]